MLLTIERGVNMINLIKNATSLLKHNKKGGSAWVWIIVALIIAAAIIAAVVIFTQSQTHPFWEVK